MPNQELLNYIKQCLGQGMGREEIKQALLKAGWQGSEIEEGFKAAGESKFSTVAGAPTSSVSQGVQDVGVNQKKKIFLIAGAVLLVLVLGGVYWWQKSGGLKEESSVSPQGQEKLTPLEKFVSSSVAKYKSFKPSASEVEVSEFSEKIRNEITTSANQLLEMCQSYPELVDNQTLSSTLPKNFALGPVLVTDKLGSEVYAQTGFGEGCLYLTKDKGNSWQKLNSLNDIIVYYEKLENQTLDLESCRDIPESVVVGVSNAAFEDEGVAAVAVVSEKSPEIFANVRGNCLYKSQDGGNTWKRISVELDPYDSDLAVSPYDHNHLYTGHRRESLDGGKTWQLIKVREPEVSEFIQDGKNKTKTIDSIVEGTAVVPGNKLVYASTIEDISVSWYEENGPATNARSATSSIYKSEDGGKSWNKIYEFVDADGKASRCSYSYIKASQKNADIIYAACDHLYRSLDGGKTWSVILRNDESKNQRIPASLIVTGGLVYGVNPASGIELFFRSGDNGKTWTIKKVGFHIYQIAVRPLDNKTVFATDFDHNVYVSKDSGDSWSKIDLPVKLGTNDVISDIVFHEPSKTLFVGTSKGMIRIPIE